MWRWLQKNGKQQMKGYDPSNLVFNEWFKADPDAAIAAFKDVNAEFRSSVASALMGHLLTAEGPKLQKLLAVIDDLVAAGGRLWYGGPQTSSGEHAARVLSFPPSRGRDALVQNLVQGWVDQDWKAATAWTATLEEPLKSTITAGLASSVFHSGIYPGVNARNGPAAAALQDKLAWAREWMTTSASPEVRIKLGPQFVSALATIDPAAALTWAQDNLHARPLSKAVADVVKKQVAGQPAEIRAMIDQLPPGGMKQQAAFAAVTEPSRDSVEWLLGQADKKAFEWGTVGSQWGFKQPEAFRDFLSDRDFKDLPNTLIQGGLGSLVRKDAAGTMDWAAKQPDAGFAEAAFQQWEYEDIARAAAWAKEHPSAANKLSRLGATAGRYFRQSPKEAVEWAASLIPGPARDASVSALREQIQKSPIADAEKTALNAVLGVP